MKRILMTIALTCLLSVSAFAGDIPCGGAFPNPGNVNTGDPTMTIVLTIIGLLR